MRRQVCIARPGSGVALWVLVRSTSVSTVTWDGSFDHLWTLVRISEWNSYITVSSTLVENLFCTGHHMKLFPCLFHLFFPTIHLFRDGTTKAQDVTVVKCHIVSNNATWLSP